MLQCFGCWLSIDEAATWLEDDRGYKYPFHSPCANEPWPMFECVVPSSVRDGRHLMQNEGMGSPELVFHPKAFSFVWPMSSTQRTGDATI